jgi:hypothetical protein
MNKFDELLIKSASIALVDDLPNFRDLVHDKFNLFELVDSFTIVNILLESENELELKFGKYEALADERIFDATKSPFLQWSEWVDYVKRVYDGS